MKKLQVCTPRGWEYVFCRNVQHNRVITTDDKSKALPHKAWQGQDDKAYFERWFSDYTFRLGD